MFTSFKALRLISLIILSLSIFACQTTSQTSSVPKDFRKGPEGGVDLIWTPDSVLSNDELYGSLKPYNKILLDPIILSLKASQTSDGFDPAELNKLTKEFQKEIRFGLGKEFTFVKEPGPGVLRVSIALTGVESPNKAGAILSTVLPVGLLLSAASKVTTGEHTGVGSATMEAVLSDAQTGKIIVVGLDRYAGSKGVGAISDEFDAAREAFKWWAGRLNYSLKKSKTL